MKLAVDFELKDGSRKDGDDDDSSGRIRIVPEAQTIPTFAHGNAAQSAAG